ncbi:MAG TPA: hypothetical protein VF681_07005 [Abditibacteriaceae bacterium]
MPFLSGCAAKESPLVRDVARAILTARADEQTRSALRSGDDAKLRAAIDEAARLDTQNNAGKNTLSGAALRLRTAEDLVVAGVRAEIGIKDSPMAAIRVAQSDAAANHRRALAISPDFPSKDSQLLNALGYFLADRGTSREDFLKAEKFTRRAVALLTSKTPDAGRANTRDSLAWALFKLGRLEEAEKEQREAIREARETKNMGAELALHFGEILAKAGKKDEARAALKEAIALPEGEHDAHERARKLLQTL